MKNLLKFVFLFAIITFSQQLNSQCVNEALDFDGANDYVNINLPNPIGPFTVSAWFNSSSATNGNAEDRIFSFLNPRLEVGLEDNFPNPGDVGRLWVNDNEATPSTMSFPTGNLHDDMWHQVTITRLLNSKKIYLDGIPIGSWTATQTNYSGNFRIGTWNGSPSAFKGMIDDVAFYDLAFIYDQQALDNYNCSPIGNEPSLIGYWPFENGDPGNSNTGITTTPDIAGGIGDGTLVGFGLTGTASNFVCPSASYVETCMDFSCDAACDTTTLDLSTGYDISGQCISTLMHTSKWQVVSTPPSSGVNPGLFGYILNTPSAWSNIPGAKYISPFPDIQNQFDNIGNNTSFDLETCFCVCDDNSTITIDLSAYADNALNLDLYDESNQNGGSFIMDLLDISSAEGTGAFNGATFDAIHTLTLDAGQYCLLSKLQNDGTVYMGMSINATVTGAGLIKAECCGTNNGITGFVYDDKNCNGNYDMFVDQLVTGANMEVCDANGSTLETVMTDALGLYTFDNLGAGDFTIKMAPLPNYESVETPLMPLSLAENEVIGNINFGLNYTGPVTVEPFQTTCIQAGGTFEFEWCGESCDCPMKIYSRQCSSSGAYDLIASVDNTRSYTWEVPNDLMGDYEFMLEDCNGNQYPWSTCLTIVDYDLNILVSQTDCGIYEFNAELIGSTSAIQSYSWNFGSYQNSSAANPTIDFNSQGTYYVLLSVTTLDGCNLRSTLSLVVPAGTEDDCTFCEPDVQIEVESGDIYLEGTCYGVIITSPNGSCFRITVQDDGNLITEPVDCP